LFFHSKSKEIFDDIGSIQIKLLHILTELDKRCSKLESNKGEEWRFLRILKRLVQDLIDGDESYFEQLKKKHLDKEWKNKKRKL